MATLQELRTLFNNSDMMEKTESALIIGANDLLSGTPTADQQRWAAAAFGAPTQEARKAWMAVLASNSGLAVATILGATDTAIQNNVDSVIPTLVVAYAGTTV